MEVVEKREESEVRVKKKTLMAVLEECQRALESLDDDLCSNDDDEKIDEKQNCSDDPLAEELRGLIESRINMPEFLGKLECTHLAVQPSHSEEEGSSWDIVTDNDLWQTGSNNNEDDEEDFVLVRQEDIVDAIASFMAAYLLSLKETKELTPNQLQNALRKTFSLKKKKGKLRKALDGTKIVYNVASWSATAIGIYQNPALLKAASTAFWTSCRVISRLF